MLKGSLFNIFLGSLFNIFLGSLFNIFLGYPVGGRIDSYRRIDCYERKIGSAAKTFVCSAGNLCTARTDYPHRSLPPTLGYR